MLGTYTEPRIIKNFISRDDCEFIMKYKTLTPDLFEDDTVECVDDSQIDQHIKDLIKYDRRLVKISYIGDYSIPVIKKIYNACAKLIHSSIDCIEKFNITKYEIGGFFKEHVDEMGEMTGYGIRTHTLIIALNDSYQEGETEFPYLNKKFKMKMGDALLFHNLDSNGEYTRLASHRGNVVKSGEKWICNLWIHDKPLPVNERMKNI